MATLDILELGRLFDEVYLLRREVVRLEERYDDALEAESSDTHDLEADLTLTYGRLAELEHTLNAELGNSAGYDLDLARVYHHPTRGAYLRSLKQTSKLQGEPSHAD